MESLDNFYQELIEIWKTGGKDGGEGGWAGCYYGIVSKVINDNDFKKCAEIGIGYGFHSKEILDKTNVEQLHLIDPMTFYPNDGFATDVLKYGGFEKLVQNINLHLKEHESRYIWHRQPSTTITQEQIVDESLDLVFVDADHSYQAVSHDLPFWWRKIRKGGWLMGDDYASCHPGTKKAVDEWSTKMGLEFRFLYKPNNSYPIYYFIKQ